MKPKVVLITGGSRGIGFATAKMFLESGAKVSYCGVKDENVKKSRLDLARLDSTRQAKRARLDLAKRAEKELGRVGDTIAIKADVRNYKEVSELVDKTIKKFGRIDILVNNAGVAWSGEFANEEVENMDELVDVNVKGVLYTARAVLPQMTKQGGGVIINVSSGAGKSGISHLATYSATKFAVVGFTEALAGEVGKSNIRVYAICPGSVATDMIEEITGRKIGMPPEKIARKILDLAGPNPPISPGECLEVYY